MIKANELRIGNYILLGGEHIAKVEIINSQENTITTENPYNRLMDGTTGDHIYLPSGFAIGIPLTPGWLQRCGYCWKKNIHRWAHVSGHLAVQDDLGFHNGHGDGSFRQPPLKYVHQLQNVYFALTGEELSIDLGKTLSV